MSTHSLTPPGRERQVSTILDRIVRLSRAMAGPRSAPFGGTALTRTQLDFLFLLARAGGPVTPGELAEAPRTTDGAI